MVDLFKFWTLVKMATSVNIFSKLLSILTKVKPNQHMMSQGKFFYRLQGIARFAPLHLTGVFESLKDESISIKYLLILVL